MFGWFAAMATHEDTYLEVERHHTRVCPKCREVVFLEKNQPAPENSKVAHPWHYEGQELTETEFHQYVAMAFEKGVIQSSHKAKVLHEGDELLTG